MNIVPHWDIYGHLQACVLRYSNSGQYSPISVQQPYSTTFTLSIGIPYHTILVLKFEIVHFTLFVLRLYGPVNPMGSCRARSVYLTTRLLGRLSPLSD